MLSWGGRYNPHGNGKEIHVDSFEVALAWLCFTRLPSREKSMAIK
jgi:hypothetical protein